MMNKKKSQKYIKNDNDIITVITGFKAILSDLMRYDDPEEYEQTPKQAETPGEEKKVEKMVIEETVTYDGWYNWYYDEGKVSLNVVVPTRKYDLIQMSCFEELTGLLLGSLNCWNDLDVFRVKQTYFNRLGIFPYLENDYQKMQDKIDNDGDAEAHLAVIAENNLKI